MALENFSSFAHILLLKQRARLLALTVVGLHPHRSVEMSTLLMIILVLLLVGSLPTWPYSSGWGYYPACGLGVILLVALVLLLFRGSTV